MLQVTSGPAVEPLTTDDARDQLRVDLTVDDALIDAAIVAARSYAETFMHRALITQTVTITEDCLQGGVFVLPVMPIQSVTSVKYKASGTGTLTTWDSANWQHVKTSYPNFIAPVFNGVWPTIRADFGALEVVAVAGYGDSPAAVPGDIIQAVKLLVAHFYENRSNEIAGTIVSKLTLGAERLMMPHVLHV